MKAVVIVANGWNAGWLGCYGNEWVATPHVDRLAVQSVVFDQHFAANPSPSDWRRSLTSGYFELGSETPRSGLFRSFRRAGARMIRIQDLRAVSENNQDDWDSSFPIVRSEEAPPGEALLAAVAEQLASLAANHHWMLWIETDRLVPPWSVSLDHFDRYVEGIPPDDNGMMSQPWDDPAHGQIALSDRDILRLQGTFASVVTEWDADLGGCFELFRQFGLAESALWIVTSGHGVSLGEHGWVGPIGARPYEEFAHVPLIVRLPNEEQASRRVAEMTSSVDVMPSLAEAFQLPLSSQPHGRSLLQVARGSRQQLRNYDVQKIGLAWALRTPDWAYFGHVEGHSLLYRKPEDRFEVNDVSMPHLEWADHLKEAHRQFIRATLMEPFAPPELREYDDVVASTRE